ncbi:hypothetical protein [Nannocystis pusilla]|uniref:Lipocalin-like domain-containing protein n=1 Tax=Nannocystis pusilla TaxID=889268 RepID=A0ABS7U1D2_9BACT|nr:hypothetical protein [Nannocystis pusilla]MBZ5714273.1 hypothetical protein [Nannocystis pusilla]
MDLSGRWEFSFDRTLNGQLAPTTVPSELIIIQLDADHFVGRYVFPGDDPSRFEGTLYTSERGTLFSIRQTNERTGYHALYVGKVENATSLSGIFTDVAGPAGDVRLRKIP